MNHQLFIRKKYTTQRQKYSITNKMNNCKKYKNSKSIPMRVIWTAGLVYTVNSHKISNSSIINTHNFEKFLTP